MSKRKLAEKITIKCYGEEEIWESRKKAMDFYYEGMMCCEGSEKDRYATIYSQLVEGFNYCSDEN